MLPNLCVQTLIPLFRTYETRSRTSLLLPHATLQQPPTIAWTSGNRCAWKLLLRVLKGTDTSTRPLTAYTSFRGFLKREKKTLKDVPTSNRRRRRRRRRRQKEILFFESDEMSAARTNEKRKNVPQPAKETQRTHSKIITANDVRISDDISASDSIHFAYICIQVINFDAVMNVYVAFADVAIACENIIRNSHVKK